MMFLMLSHVISYDLMLSHVISYYLMFILEHLEQVEVPGHLPGTLSGAEGWVSPSGIVPGLESLGLKIARVIWLCSA